MEPQNTPRQALNLPLKALIISRFGTQTAAAVACGVDNAEITHAIRRKQPSPRLVRALSDIFGKKRIQRILAEPGPE